MVLGDLCDRSPRMQSIPRCKLKNSVQVRCLPVGFLVVCAKSIFSFDKACLFQIVKRTLYGTIGYMEILSNGADRREALALLVGSILEITIYIDGTGREI